MSRANTVLSKLFEASVAQQIFRYEGSYGGIDGMKREMIVSAIASLYRHANSLVRRFLDRTAVSNQDFDALVKKLLSLRTSGEVVDAITKEASRS